MLCYKKLNCDLQGGVRFPTGGIAREPKGMTRCDSGADSTVWMEEDRVPQRLFAVPARVWKECSGICRFQGFFVCRGGGCPAVMPWTLVQGIFSFRRRGIREKQTRTT